MAKNYFLILTRVAGDDVRGGEVVMSDKTKFNKERWRILAENKPDELHSYVPQSSINELFDEIERLEKENFRLKEANEDVQSRLDDYRQDYATVVNDQCPTDERHCGCVPILRRENRILSEDLANAKDELKHRRDALVDAQNIYNDANNHRMRYLTALELIASFVNAKDKTSVDDLIAIAGKELNCSSDRILDACNYWVMRLREEENKSRLVYGDFFDKAVIALGFSSATLPVKEAEEKLLKRISDLFWLVRNLSDALDCVYGKLPAHWRELPFSYHELKRKVKEVMKNGL